MNNLEELKVLYAKNSKHSNYQILSKRLSALIASDQIEVKSRYELERLNYVLDKVSLVGKSVLDIGGNTGYFTFEAIQAGAKSAHHYEGNAEHSEFVATASKVLGCDAKVAVTNGYFSFEDQSTSKYDVAFLLNVLHHVGDDYGDAKQSIEDARKKIGEQLVSMAKIADTLVFQLGFCWKGNRETGLFENGTKKELIDFVISVSSGVYRMHSIGIPVRRDGIVSYEELDAENIERDDSLGEFLNRPLFVMKAI